MSIPKQGETLSGGWTLDTLQQHWEAIREADQKFDIERDRRYSEVNIEREKALKIKEEADKAALGLAREIQSYKDEKANQLREQITGERGSFATKEDLAAAQREISAQLAPITAFVSASTGSSKGLKEGWGFLVGAVGLVGGVIVAVIAIVEVITKH
jgi:hypothetical protein